jgi:hypothetical protein
MCTDLESVDLPATRGQEALQPTATLVSLTDENVGDIGPFFGVRRVGKSLRLILSCVEDPGGQKRCP